MTSAHLLIGDVRAVLAELPDGTDLAAWNASGLPGPPSLILSSPPFLAVRSYLPADHPDKALEIGSEATPAAYLDTLLDVMEACARVLAPHGSLAFELGDTYAGSNQVAGRGKFWNGYNGTPDDSAMAPGRSTSGNGWPLDKSLCGIPQAFMLSLAYGRNLLNPERTTPPWRIRTLKPWIRTNPPVGALGDKERPATSYVIVATKARDRWFDLDAVRTAYPNGEPRRGGSAMVAGVPRQPSESLVSNPAGAPPLDWWCHVDAVLDQELARRKNYGSPAARFVGEKQPHLGSARERGETRPAGATSEGATGAHLRRALQAAGILHLEEAVDQSPGGYSGAHYAVWPPELCALLIKEMCPREVCRQCGVPRRRIVKAERVNKADDRTRLKDSTKERDNGFSAHVPEIGWEYDRRTLGWSDCGHGPNNYRPGVVLDPFVGSGTTLEVATGHGRDAIGIDLDARNEALIWERVGMFLQVRSG